MGASFTFIQAEQAAIAAPMQWSEEGEDDSGHFRIFAPAEDFNPYLRHKIGRAEMHGRAFVFHTFYRREEVAFDRKKFMEIMIALIPVSKWPLMKTFVLIFLRAMQSVRI